MTLLFRLGKDAPDRKQSNDKKYFKKYNYKKIDQRKLRQKKLF